MTASVLCLKQGRGICVFIVVFLGTSSTLGERICICVLEKNTLANEVS